MVLPVQDEKELCKFFLKGRCKFGLECRYNHERPRCFRGSRPTCIYFVKGNCNRGTNCYFLHDEILQANHVRDEPKLPIPQLPSEVLEMVFRSVYPEDILECMQVWSTLFEGDYVWKELFIAHFGDYKSVGQLAFGDTSISDSPKLCSWRADYMRSLYTELDQSAIECCSYKQKIDPNYSNLVSSISNILQDARSGGYTFDLLFAVDARDELNSLQRAAKLGLDSIVTLILQEASQGGFVKELMLNVPDRYNKGHSVGGTALHHAISITSSENLMYLYPSIVSTLLKEAAKGGFCKRFMFVKDNNNETALHKAVGGGSIPFPEIVASLLEAAEEGGFLEEILLTEAGRGTLYGDVFEVALRAEFPDERNLTLLEKYSMIIGKHRYYNSLKKKIYGSEENFEAHMRL